MTILALAVGTALLAAACSGEQASSPRDGGTGAGAAGSMGAGGRGGEAGSAAPGAAGSGGGGVAGGTGNEGGAGSLGQGGSAGQAGSAGSAGSGAAAGTGGQGGTGGAGGASGGQGGSAGVGGKANGTACSAASDCASNQCWDGVCCASDCSGTCRTCNGASAGTCVFAPDGQDPRDQCPVDTGTPCGRTGACNGSGACRYQGSTVVCDSTPACDSGNASIVMTKVCNGAGACVVGTSQSCNGFLCTPGSPPTCGTSCTGDGACVSGGFCSAGGCVAIANLVGNGDLESGTTTGWLAANGGGVINLSSASAGGAAHTGDYAVYASNRSQYYQGPGYNIPTGPGKYVISAWALQRDLPSIVGVLQIRLACKTNINPGYYVEVTPNGSFGQTMNQNVWTQFSATVDTTVAGNDCLPTAATPGLVRLATLYLNHTDTSASAPYPDLYLDDVVVQVTDGHNIVGNPNFEAGFTDGWSLSAGSSTLSISDTVAHTGTHSLKQSGRSIPAAGPRYALTNGAARYAFSFWVKHMGTQARDLILQPTYSCITPSGQVTPPPIKTLTGVPGDTWTEVTGTAVYPPIDAPAGCKLSSAAIYVRTDGTTCGAGAGQVECPDLYIDDVSIKLGP